MVTRIKKTMAGFSQILTKLDMKEFAKICQRHPSNAKGFSTYTMLVSLIISHMSGCDSLREINKAIASFGGELIHMGLSQAPPPASLSYALQHRDPIVFEEFFYHSYKIFSNVMPTSPGQKQFSFKNPLFAIDSTIIALCLSLYDWAQYRTGKGAVKLHTMLNNRNHLPCWAMITEGKTHDVNALPHLDDHEELTRGAILLIDRGYIDYEQFRVWNDKGIFFITRTKKNMSFEVVAERPVPAPVGRPPAAPEAVTPKSRVLSDTIVLCSKDSRSKYPGRLRLVRFLDLEENREYEFLTNNFKLAAITIANCYKERWSIETFFRSIKQNMIVKSFLGTSYNAVASQLWTALISIMLLKYLQFLSRQAWSLSGFISLVRLYLTVHVDMLALIKSLHVGEGEERPPPPVERPQSSLPFERP
jgi:hypothetical protein